MYLDSSVLIKLLVKEPGSEHYNGLTSGQALASSELATTEVWAALVGKEHESLITPDECELAWETFQGWIGDELIAIYSLNSAVLRRANQVIRACAPRVPIRSLDAIHVAACDLTSDLPLCTDDRHLQKAALAFGLNVTALPPT